jgi:hypothetical protein
MTCRSSAPSLPWIGRCHLIANLASDNPSPHRLPRLKREPHDQYKKAQSPPLPLAAIFRGGPHLRTHPEKRRPTATARAGSRGMGTASPSPAWRRRVAGATPSNRSAVQDRDQMWCIKESPADGTHGVAQSPG